MAKQKFTHFIPREKPKKRKGVHTKSQNKNAKRQKKQTRYKGQGRWLINLFIIFLVCLTNLLIIWIEYFFQRRRKRNEDKWEYKCRYAS
jgi:cytoskeletal protein RodZ